MPDIIIFVAARKVAKQNNEVWLSLVERCVRDAEAVGSSPATSTTSEQALYRLLRFFAKNRAHACRCSSFPNRTRFAGLRFGLRWTVHFFSLFFLFSWIFPWFMIFLSLIFLLDLFLTLWFPIYVWIISEQVLVITRACSFFPFSGKKPHPVETNGSNRMRLLPFIISRCRVVCERRNTYPFPLP